MLNLTGAKVRKVDHPTKSNCFELSLPKRVLFICADNPEGVQQWVDDLSKSIANCSTGPSYLNASGGGIPDIDMEASSIGISGLSAVAATALCVGATRAAVSGKRGGQPGLMPYSPRGGNRGGHDAQVQNNPFFGCNEGT